MSLDLLSRSSDTPLARLVGLTREY